MQIRRILCCQLSHVELISHRHHSTANDVEQICDLFCDELQSVPEVRGCLVDQTSRSEDIRQSFFGKTVYVHEIRSYFFGKIPDVGQISSYGLNRHHLIEDISDRFCYQSEYIQYVVHYLAHS